MADIPPQLIKIGISWKTTPNNAPVYLKSDRTRFECKYRIDVVIKPGAEAYTYPGVPLSSLIPQTHDPQSVVYTGIYDSEGVAHTKSGERQPVQVNMQFTQAGLFETKFYNYNKRDHCQWGNSFNSIEYECKPNDTHTLMWINKELFL
uniref:Cannabinoid receptor interacting protein 1b n=1 Tax=Sinocyclocheilus grahami TaxID=75366 RepID=A0A672NR59_SINGR